jgi:hypothetical protein
MYLASVERPAGTLDRTKRIAGNVLALGAVSLVTDVSSEMVAAVLPLYLVVGLGLGPVVYGVLDGLYTGATALLRLVGGYLADRVQRRKLVAGLGYGISAVAMDSAGAFAGPLVALAVLAASGQAFDAVFVVSGLVAAIGVLMLVLLVRDHREPRHATKVDLRAAMKLLHIAPIRLLTLGAALLGLSTIGDGFVYLLLQRRENLATGWFPLLAVGTSLAYLILAVPLGTLADRVGRTPVFLAGYAALAAVYLLLTTAWGGLPALLTVLLLYGVFYAATDGVLMALAGPLLPAALRTTGLALIQTGQALAYLVSSVLFGLAWSWWGAGGAIRAAAIAAVVTLSASAALLSRTRKAAPLSPAEGDAR